MKFLMSAAGAAAMVGACAALAQAPATRSVTVDADGVAHVVNGTIPPSNIMSPEALNIIKRARPTEGPGALPAPSGTMAEIRKTMNERLQPNVAHMREIFPVDIEETVIDGVSVAIITPKGGVPKENASRLVLNAPGGGFVTGIRANGLFISIPFAALGRMKVVSLLYRQAPEYRFPSATEDFTKVYRAMLKTYKPANIGFVGCSAGGALVAETIAALPKAGLPRPAVAGIYCSGANAKWMTGDSASFASLVTPTAPSMPPGPSYFEGMDMNDPAISPSDDPAVLAKFPPTIYGTGTRDFAMSQAALSYRKMVAAGVESQLMIFDGMAHGFMTNPDFPESRELYTAGVRFFDKHMGR
jgi:monoterpene epsilon-lactone hydrolase